MKRGLVCALGAIALASTASAQDYVEGQLIIKTTNGRSVSSLAGVASAQAPYRSGAQLVNLRAGVDVLQAAADLSATPGVAYAEPNYIVHAAVVPNDPNQGSQWAWGVIDAYDAWDTQTGNANVQVNVTDTGIMTDHPDLVDNVWVNAAEASGTPGVDDDGNGYVDDINGWNARSDNGNLIDDNGHGTHCSGSVGATSNNGLLVAGVNWTTSLVGCKFLSGAGSGSTGDAVECFDYIAATNAAGTADIRVSSNSWGGGGQSNAIRDAMSTGGNEDVLFVIAAGNSGADNDCTPSAAFPSAENVPNVIAVASTTSTDNISGFSQYGQSTVDIGAPGSNILSTWNNGSTRSISGTSMATPHVAGAAALALAENPSLSVDGLRDVVICGSEATSAMDGVTSSGNRLNLDGVVAAAAGGVTCGDRDSDGVDDHEDNCPYDSNPSQDDGNDDGVGDACEPDCGGCG